MDPFTEKDIVDNLRSIAASLRNMDRKMDDIVRSIQDFGADFSETEEDESGENERDGDAKGSASL